MRERMCYACPHLRPHTTRRCPLTETTMVAEKRVAPDAPREFVPRRRLEPTVPEPPPPPPADRQLQRDSLIYTSDSFNPLVYQCLDGHIMRTCARCWPKIHITMCPACKETLNTRKCTQFDKIVDALFVPCRHREVGCTEMVQCNRQRLKHMKTICERMPGFTCPCPGCKFSGDKFTLPGHLREKHEVPTVNLDDDSNQVSFKLEPEDRMVMVKGVEPDTMYLLHREFKDDFRGEIFFLTSFGVDNKVCILRVTGICEDPSTYINPHLVVDVRCADESREEGFLFHPFPETDTCEGYDIEIEIVQTPEEEEEEEEEDAGDDRATTSGEAPGASAA